MMPRNSEVVGFDFMVECLTKSLVQVILFDQKHLSCTIIGKLIERRIKQSIKDDFIINLFRISL